MVRLLVLCLIVPCLFWSAPAFSSDAVLVEANTKFTYQARPISPALVRAFQNWESDYRAPITVTVDVGAAFESNQYGGEMNVGEGGLVTSVLDDGGQFSYRHLGRVAQDIHVLHTLDKAGGGTGLFQTLTFVKFQSDQRFDRDGRNPSVRLLMTVVRLYPLMGTKPPHIELEADGVSVDEGHSTVHLSFARPPVGLANPASENCAKLGGKRESRTTNQGESSYCHLPNGKVCEEWSLYRGTCF